MSYSTAHAPEQEARPAHSTQKKRGGILAPLLIGLGVLLLVLAVLFPTVILGGVKKTPLDPARTESVAEGSGKIFDAEKGELVDVPHIQATRWVSIDTKASDSDVAVFQATLCVRSEPKSGKPGECDPKTDDKVLSFSCDRAATKREEAVAVNDKKYFDKAYNEPGCKDKDGNPLEYPEHEGLTYKFPFDTTADGTYMMNDDDNGGAVKAEYVGEENIQGVDVLHFKADFPEGKTMIKETFPGTIKNDIEYWVEPTTGLIIKGSQHQVQKFENGDLAADVNLAFTQDNIDKNVEKANDSIAKLDIVKLWAPIGCAVLGVLLIAAGLIVLKKRAEDTRDGDYADSAYAER